MCLSTKRSPPSVAMKCTLATFGLIAICSALSCGVFSDSNDGEHIFPATEVGTPIGELVRTEIGPSGGVLATQDGRLTLRVPPDTLTKTISFSIQAITNKAEGGTGVAYRLQPDGSTFRTPVELSLRYVDEDVQGTDVKAISVAYQAPSGNWHELRTRSIDEETRTITVLTTHFTDVASVPRFRLSPDKATVRVGESIPIEIKGCREPTLFDRVARLGDLSNIATCINPNSPSHLIRWESDIGTVVNDANPTTFTAPAKKPSKKIATVSYVYTTGRHDELGRQIVERISAKITIVDRGYWVHGITGGDTVVAGHICDPEKPFRLQTNNPFLSSINFVPSSQDGGTWTVSTKGGITGGSGGQYTLTDTQLVVMGFGTACAPVVGCVSGGGTGSPINLTPLAPGEDCSSK